MSYVVPPAPGRQYWRGRGRLSSGDFFNISMRVTTRELAQARLRRYIDEREKELLGMLPPKALRDAAGKSLVHHLSDYIDALRGKGVSAKHLLVSRNRTPRLASQCGWRTPRDVTASSFEAWRAKALQPKPQGLNLAPKTINEYHGLASAFFSWLVRSGRMIDNPLKTLEKTKTRGKERRVRRALRPEELSLLRSSLRRLGGGKRLYREVFYVFSYFTGSRRGETYALLCHDLHLEAERPFVKLRANTTKSATEAVLPLWPEVADLLREHLARLRLTQGRVFPFGLPSVTTFQRDLHAAGIEHTDALGRRVDVHALRMSFATELLKNGVAVRTVQELMRHSDVRLTTETYTDAKVLPLFEAVKAVKVPMPTVSQLVPHPRGKTGQKESTGG